jgi:hypothetical protein
MRVFNQVTDVGDAGNEEEDTYIYVHSIKS